MKNSYEVRGEITAIFLKRTNGTILETIIDTKNLKLAESIPGTWYPYHCKTSDTYYVLSHVNKQARLLHRIVFGISKNDKRVIDHINHNPLDNRLVNLRAVSQTENMRNRVMQKNNKSGIRNVSWNRTSKKWEVCVRVNRKTIRCGMYENIVEAEKAAINAREKYFK